MNRIRLWHSHLLLFSFLFVVIYWGIATKNKLNHDKDNSAVLPDTNGLQRTAAANYRDSLLEGDTDKRR